MEQNKLKSYQVHFYSKREIVCKKLIKNKNLRIELGKAARQTITENFDVCKMTKKIESLYTNVLSEN